MGDSIMRGMPFDSSRKRVADTARPHFLRPERDHILPAAAAARRHQASETPWASAPKGEKTALNHDFLLDNHMPK